MTLALIDGNAFYCSCERVFDPKVRKRPVIVLSSNDGCAVARTSEAKALGIKMGQPYFMIRDLCRREGVAVFSSIMWNMADKGKVTGAPQVRGALGLPGSACSPGLRAACPRPADPAQWLRAHRR